MDPITLLLPFCRFRIICLTFFVLFVLQGNAFLECAIPFLSNSEKRGEDGMESGESERTEKSTVCTENDTIKANRLLRLRQAE